ncbi:PQQ-binding-like beta-propeller repeat protein [Novosphingobium sp. SL115]|uniref:outer membrane protein assembly factor BamB family protein n=1 Tax=Novosphingobium sp. SL115 TaxID=2995150 RepID=UPI002273E5D7|nr:PQQ-binding-like beta-propeller repeat protein [Novosphingobium sp. SL115]MCY1672072.1 PQQ-binding-like beta-propeller repeat protein [Novosphingobium sp. SL115]
MERLRGSGRLRPLSVLAAGIAAVALAAAGHNAVGRGLADQPAADDWATYGGDAGGSHHSTLATITRDNVRDLAPVWRFDTGLGGLQTSPLVADGVLYAMTPAQEVIALDGANGRLLWKHAIAQAGQQPVRGLSLWREGAQQRLLVGAGPWLIALDPATGQPAPGFGSDGRVDLREGLGRPAEQVPLAMTSPGVIWGDTIIVGFRTAEAKPAAPGAVRAYDVRTGKLRWTFDLLPKPGQPGSETWADGALEGAGAINSWPGMVVDQHRGIVFVPTGSAADDFYGADRKGQNLYANSLVALDARDGRHLWHYQLVHHDIWDRDLPSPPVLLTVNQGGRRIDAVAQATKQGFVFLFDRVTGKPLFPIDEMPFPASTVPGEEAWATQPVPRLPAPFARQRLDADMLTQRTPEAHAAVAAAFADMRSEGLFVPLSVGKPTVVFPGFDGGAEWGGQAADPATGVLFINANDVPWTGALAPVAKGDGTGGEAVYQQNCAACHGVDRKGSPPEFPSLEGVMGRHMEGDVFGIIMGGKGRMPAFSHLDQAQLLGLVDYLRRPADGPQREMVAGQGAAGAAQGYVFTGYRKFVDPDGYPAVVPPWGTLSAIDMNDGRTLWRVPLGRYPALAKPGMPDSGSENYGGPLLTQGGVLFIGATIHDRLFRAFDPRDGRVLWEAGLPYAGVATPITYSVGGRQFVVIAASGARDPAGPQGSAYVAFALPERGARLK